MLKYFVIRNFRGTCWSVKCWRSTWSEKLGTPALERQTQRFIRAMSPLADQWPLPLYLL